MPSTRTTKDPGTRSTVEAGVQPLTAAPALPTPRRRRRPALLALGVLLVVLGALGASYLATSLSHTVPVIALARAVPRGQELKESDLAEAHVAPDPALSPIPFADRGSVVGQVAATDLEPGTLLSRAAVGSHAFPPAGQAVVGVGVTAARAPATPLHDGDRVLLVPAIGSSSTPQSSLPGTAAASTVAATVVTTGPVGVDGLRVVDVLVQEDQGPDVAARAAAGQIAIVLVSGD